MEVQAAGRSPVSGGSWRYGKKKAVFFMGLSVRSDPEDHFLMGPGKTGPDGLEGDSINEGKLGGRRWRIRVLGQKSVVFRLGVDGPGSAE